MEMPRFKCLCFRWMTRGYQANLRGGFLVPHYWRSGGRGWRVALPAYGLLFLLNELWVPVHRKNSTSPGVMP